MKKIAKKKVKKIVQVAKKGQQNIFFKADQINLAQFLVHKVRAQFLVPCANSVQRCAEFDASASEGVRHSGWKFSILEPILN